MTRKAVHVRLELLSSSAGGRSTPMRSGYRSLIRFENTEVDFGFELNLATDSLAPGDNGIGTASFWAVEDLPPLLPGQKFEVREGTRVVGHGEVLPETAPQPA